MDTDKKLEKINPKFRDLRLDLTFEDGTQVTLDVETEIIGQGKDDLFGRLRQRHHFESATIAHGGWVLLWSEPDKGRGKEIDLFAPSLYDRLTE